MNFMLKSLSALALTVSLSAAFAAPIHLTTHNNTNEESNAFVAGIIPSPHPTAAYSTRQVYWNMVRIACYGHTVAGKCPATVKMATNTANPIAIAEVSMNLESGVITVDKVLNTQYSITVNGLGETTLSKN